MSYHGRTYAIVTVGAGIALPTLLALFSPLLFASGDQLLCGTYLSNLTHLWGGLLENRVFEILRPCTVAALHGIALLQLLLIILGCMLTPANLDQRATQTKSFFPVLAGCACLVGLTWLDFTFSGWTIERYLFGKRSQTPNLINWSLMTAIHMFFLGIATTAVVRWTPALLKRWWSR